MAVGGALAPPHGIDERTALHRGPRPGRVDEGRKRRRRGRTHAGALAHATGCRDPEARRSRGLGGKDGCQGFSRGQELGRHAQLDSSEGWGRRFSSGRRTSSGTVQRGKSASDGDALTAPKAASGVRFAPRATTGPANCQTHVVHKGRVSTRIGGVRRRCSSRNRRRTLGRQVSDFEWRVMQRPAQRPAASGRKPQIVVEAGSSPPPSDRRSPPPAPPTRGGPRTRP